MFPFFVCVCVCGGGGGGGYQFQYVCKAGNQIGISVLIQCHTFTHPLHRNWEYLPVQQFKMSSRASFDTLTFGIISLIILLTAATIMKNKYYQVLDFS